MTNHEKHALLLTILSDVGNDILVSSENVQICYNYVKNTMVPCQQKADSPFYDTTTPPESGDENDNPDELTHLRTRVSALEQYVTRIVAELQYIRATQGHVVPPPPHGYTPPSHVQQYGWYSIPQYHPGFGDSPMPPPRFR